MPIPTPNLTLTITPPNGSGINYTNNLAWSGSSGQLSIRQNFGRQGDTATIPLVDDWQGQAHPNFTIPVLSQVKLFDNIANETLFAGVINDPVLVPASNRNEWNLSCTDYTFYADNVVVAGQFFGQTVDQILISLTQQANCGITAKSIRNGGFVAPGPTLSSFILNYTTLSDAWRKLARLAAQVTPYGWYVDENRNFHFYDATTALSSGVTFTTNPTQGGVTNEGHMLLDGQFAYEWDGTSIRNKILVQGSNQTIKHGDPAKVGPTGSWRGDGNTTSWGLKYTVTGSPVLKVNGVTTSLTVFTAGNTGSPPSGWIVTQNSVGGWYLGNNVAPSSGTRIQIWYDYQIPVIAQANDLPSQHTYNGPNRGIYEEYINDTSLLTTPMAFARAQRERTEYAFAAERLTFNTSEDFLGWVRAGQTCLITTSLVPNSRTGYSWGLTNATFIVIGNSVNFVNQGGYRQAQITAIRL